jgi:DNA-directed RNA polymerase beta subunit
MNIRVEAIADKDETGAWEEITWDLFPVVDPAMTLHLDSNGLPKVGTPITPGMILIGKIGKTHDYDPSRQPTTLEIQGLPFEELRLRYGNMWKDLSLYADAGTSGLVKDAFIESCQGKQRAVVILQAPGAQDVPEHALSASLARK